MFIESFKGTLMIIERYFKGVLIKVVPRVLKEVHGSFIVFQERMVCKTRKFQGCFKDVLGAF